MAELEANLLIWLLSVMGLPLAVCQGHFGKDRFKRRIFWRAGIDAKMDTVFRVLNAEITTPSAQTIIG